MKKKMRVVIVTQSLFVFIIIHLEYNMSLLPSIVEIIVTMMTYYNVQYEPWLDRVR